MGGGLIVLVCVGLSGCVGWVVWFGVMRCVVVYYFGLLVGFVLWGWWCYVFCWLESFWCLWCRGEKVGVGLCWWGGYVFGYGGGIGCFCVG